MLSVKFKGLLFIFLICFSSSIWILPTFATENDSAVPSFVDESEGLLVQAYEAILDIEELDVDVLELLDSFNNATKFLFQAQLALDTKNFYDAKLYAEFTTEICRSLIAKVEKMKIDAVDSESNQFLSVLLLSALGLSIVLVFSMLNYRTFKNRYYNTV
ncbi:MAG: hypothetical protein QCH99_08165 [Candidatus Bathyarchaeota archaeon]|nr:hypothetical protein [Candidatus Bathyarchaeum tardum]